MQASIFDKQVKPVTMQDMFGYSREAWLAECRKTAKHLLRTMDYVTVEDILKLVPRPTYLHRNTTGAIFNNDFRSVGFTKSKNPVSKGRWIQQWRLK